METVKEIRKEIIVGLGVEKDGHVVINTDAEEIPTEVVQQIMDEVICKIIAMNTDKNLREEVMDLRKEVRIWKILAIFAIAMMFITLLKMKGVI